MRTTLALGLALLVAYPLAADDKKPAVDVAKLAGDWTFVSGARGGAAIDKDRLKAKITFAKDTVTIPTAEGEKFIMAFKIDTKANPPAIDMEIKDGPVKEGKAVGIIALDGDDLKLCYNAEGGKRPEKFESTKENNAFYFVLKRAK